MEINYYGLFLGKLFLRNTIRCNIYVRIEKEVIQMKNSINDFDVEIQIDEIGARDGRDWINDCDDDDDFDDDDD